MPLDFFIVAVSIAVIVWSANILMDGAVALSWRYRIPTTVVGLIIGFMTSVPEITVSVLAALEGNARLAIGNALGSNIANIGLVVGFGVLFGSVLAQRKIILMKFLMLAGAYLVLGVVLLDFYLSRGDALILLVLLLPSLYYIARSSEESIPEQPSGANGWVIKLFAGLVLLLIGSHYAVNSAVHIATFFGIDEIIIGLSLIAVGTSLPELATFIAGVVKKHHSIALGNIVGSNLFNVFAVIGVAALIQPLPIEFMIIERDFLSMVGITALLLILLLIKPHSNGELEVNRWKGMVLLVGFFAYLALLAKAINLL